MSTTNLMANTLISELTSAISEQLCVSLTTGQSATLPSEFIILLVSADKEITADAFIQITEILDDLFFVRTTIQRTKPDTIDCIGYREELISMNPEPEITKFMAPTRYDIISKIVSFLGTYFSAGTEKVFYTLNLTHISVPQLP
jgi:hypothetical protein